MIILLSNDDGIEAPGLRILSERLSRDHEIYVVAPNRERSATGHSLTLHEPLRLHTYNMGGHVKGAWSTTGTPSDCVKFAVTELLQVKPELVISGINNGPNLGSEILYSGTVAAAMEGAFLQIPSIAVSLAFGKERQFQTAAEFVSKLVDVFPKAHLRERSLLNVNVPNLPLNEIKGVALTELGIRLYNDWFEKRTDPRGGTYYWLAGHAIEHGEEENTDAFAVLNKMISITPITFNMTDRESLGRLEKLPALKELISDNCTAEKALKTPDSNNAS